MVQRLDCLILQVVLCTVSGASVARDEDPAANRSPKINVMAKYKDKQPQEGSVINNDFQHSKSADGRPKLDYFGFFDSPTPWAESPLTHAVTHRPSGGGNGIAEHLEAWVSLLGIGCFLCGMLVTALLAMVLYRRQKARWKHWTRLPRAQLTEPKGLNLFGGEANLTSLVPSGPNSQWSLDTTPASLLHQFTSYKGPHQPFVFQMSKPITHNTTDVMDDSSDVIVTVPEGALPEGKVRQMFVNVAINGDAMNLRSKITKSYVQLTPVVEVLCLGVQRFARPIMIRIPHRACITAGGAWRLAVLQSSSSLSENTTWKPIPDYVLGATPEQTDSIYTIDDNFIYIQSFSPTTFTCIGSTHNKKSLYRMCALTFAKWYEDEYENFEEICDNSKISFEQENCDNRSPPDGANNGDNQQSHDLSQTDTTSTNEEQTDSGKDSSSKKHKSNVDKGQLPHIAEVTSRTAVMSEPHMKLKVCICDHYMDVIKHLESLSRQSGWQRVSHAQSLNVYNQRDWKVTLLNTENEAWPWKLHPGDNMSQTIKMSSCIACPGSAEPSAVDFRLVPRDSNPGLPDKLQACFDVAQFRKQSALMNPTSIITKEINVMEVSARDPGDGNNNLLHRNPDS